MFLTSTYHFLDWDKFTFANAYVHFASIGICDKICHWDFILDSRSFMDRLKYHSTKVGLVIFWPESASDKKASLC